MHIKYNEIYKGYTIVKNTKISVIYKKGVYICQVDSANDPHKIIDAAIFASIIDHISGA